MPLIVNDFTWAQTEELVIVKIPLHNKLPRDVDLFTSSKYVKAHFPPYLFEAALHQEIDEDRSKCVLRDGHISLELAKREAMSWASLTKELTKQELIRLKEEAIAEVHYKYEQFKKDKEVLKSKRQSACVSQHMALEGKARAEIDCKKEILKTKAVNDFMTWKKTETDNDTALLPLWKKLESKPLLPPKNISEHESSEAVDDQMIFDGEKETANKADSEKRKIKRFRATNKPLPPTAPVRTFVSIKCEFTHRAFPTPMRESKFTEEEEWLSKQAEARRKTGFVAEDLRPEENNLEWLLEKGKSFHEVGNYLGAVSAFSHAIRTWDKIPELYAARANSQVQLGNWRRAIFDASECLELCRPHVSSNAELRFSCHLNRGLGLLELGKGQSALADFVEAVELHPEDGRLEHLMNRAQVQIDEQELADRQDSMRRLITTCTSDDKDNSKPSAVVTKYLSPGDLAD